VAILEITPQWVDAKVPRARPCQAGGIGAHAQVCGATPASLWERSCANGHVREVWLCGSHAVLIAKHLGQCRECADRGVTCAAVIRPLDLILLGHAGAAGR